MENIQDKIAKRAFELFEARGGQHGYHLQDWMQAEKEISTASASTGKSASTNAAADSASKIKKAPAVRAKKPAVPKKMALKK